MRSWPLALIFLAGCRCSADVPEPVPVPESGEKIPYQPRIYEDVVSLKSPTAAGCLDCTLEVRAALKKFNGVGRIEVVINEGRFDVQYDPAQISIEELLEATRATEHPAIVAPPKPTDTDAPATEPPAADAE